MYEIKSMGHIVQGVPLAILFFLSSASGNAETIQEALLSAYRHDPTLEAERWKLQSVAQGIPIAEAGYWPKLSIDGDVGMRRTTTKPSFVSDGKTYPNGYAVELSQLLFDGFRTVNSVNEANAKHLAALEGLKLKEQTILLDAAKIYIETYKSNEILSLQKSNVVAMSLKLKKTKESFSAGKRTITEVSHVESRKSEAEAEYHRAQADLVAAREEYIRAIGKVPGKLVYPEFIIDHLPKNIQQANRIGLEQNPLLARAKYNIEAARFALEKIRGERLPQINLEANYEQLYDPSADINDQEAINIQLTARIPLFQGGSLSARIKQARFILWQSQQEVESAHLRVRADITSAMGQIALIRKEITSAQDRIHKAKYALESMKRELKLGQRTLLDVLDMEKEVQDAQIALTNADTKFASTAFKLMSTIGGLGVTFLNSSPRHNVPQNQSAVLSSSDTK